MIFDLPSQPTPNHHETRLHTHPLLRISVAALGALLAVVLLGMQKQMGQFYDITNETLKTVGPILFITAAGGVLGKVIANTSMVTFIKDNATFLSAVGILFPFLLAAILKPLCQSTDGIALRVTEKVLLRGLTGTWWSAAA